MYLKIRRSDTAAQLANFNAVLANDLVVNAWVSANGVRHVSIEKTNTIHSFDSEGAASSKQIYNVSLGLGANIEDAFKKSLYALQKGLSYDQMYGRKRSYPKPSKRPTGKLDQWLLHNKGLLRAVKDADGTVVCTLEGFKDPNVSKHERLSVSGVGINFKSALTKTVRKMDALSNSASAVKYIAIN